MEITVPVTKQIGDKFFCVYQGPKQTLLVEETTVKDIIVTSFLNKTVQYTFDLKMYGGKQGASDGSHMFQTMEEALAAREQIAEDTVKAYYAPRVTGLEQDYISQKDALLEGIKVLRASALQPNEVLTVEAVDTKPAVTVEPELKEVPTEK